MENGVRDVYKRQLLKGNLRLLSEKLRSLEQIKWSLPGCTGLFIRTGKLWKN